MIKDEEPYPPPEDWTCVYISWVNMLKDQPNPRKLLKWIEQDYQGLGHYQLRGRHFSSSSHESENPLKGFYFYFEHPYDAEIFALKWSR